MSQLAAVTALTGRHYPPYINASVDPDTGDVKVRFRGNPVYGEEGAYAEGTFSPLEWAYFVRQAAENVR